MFFRRKKAKEKPAPLAAQGESSILADEEIQRIVRENEAGVADLLRVYEQHEEQYYRVSTVSVEPGVAYSTDTA